MYRDTPAESFIDQSPVFNRTAKCVIRQIHPATIPRLPSTLAADRSVKVCSDVFLRTNRSHCIAEVAVKLDSRAIEVT